MTEQNTALSLVSHCSVLPSDWLIMGLGLSLTNHVHTALTTGYRDRLLTLLPAWHTGPHHAHWVPNCPCQDIQSSLKCPFPSLISLFTQYPTRRGLLSWGCTAHFRDLQGTCLQAQERSPNAIQTQCKY